MSVDEITYDVLRRWLASDQRVVIASLVEVIGSAPLNPGALMLFGEQGEIEGSVTGGCVEGALARGGRTDSARGAASTSADLRHLR